jgi:hypothetical protein
MYSAIRFYIARTANSPQNMGVSLLLEKPEDCFLCSHQKLMIHHKTTRTWYPLLRINAQHLPFNKNNLSITIKMYFLFFNCLPCVEIPHHRPQPLPIYDWSVVTPMNYNFDKLQWNKSSFADFLNQYQISLTNFTFSSTISVLNRNCSYGGCCCGHCCGGWRVGATYYNYIVFETTSDYVRMSKGFLLESICQPFTFCWFFTCSGCSTFYLTFTIFWKKGLSEFLIIITELKYCWTDKQYGMVTMLRKVLIRHECGP